MRKNILCVLFLISFYGLYAQTLTSTGSMLLHRYCHQSQLLSNGRVLAFGGDDGVFSSSNVIYRAAELYNPSTGTWSATGQMNKKRTNFASVVLPNGNVLAIGGQVDVAFNSTASCEIYNVSTGGWSYTDSTQFQYRNHKAMLLKNGKVLVIGSKCELYDPSINKWSATGNLSVAGWGFGNSVVMLSNGHVLVTFEHNAQIYDPSLGTWRTLIATTIGLRQYHSSVLLNDGRVLISGSSDPSAQQSSEIFDPVTETFQTLVSTMELRNNTPAILMDNGNVLAYGVGDFLNPSNTKVIEVYSPVSNTWFSNTYTHLGSQEYSILKLGNGKIMIVGGRFPLASSATASCYLIDQNLSPCTAPNLFPGTISGSTNCWGSAGTVAIGTSQNGMLYTAYIGGLAVSNSVTGTGGSITIPISVDLLYPGVNPISIRVKAPGCPSYLTNATANITITQGNISISASKVFLCPGDSALLEAPVSYTSYQWSNGATTKDIYAKLPGDYTVLVTNATGCKSLSGKLTISGSPSAVNAGTDQSVCSGDAAYVLVGSPFGGVWSGTGISSGNFDPSAAGAGVHTLTYTYCNQSDTRDITVTNSVTPSVSISIVEGFNPLGSGGSIRVQAVGVNTGTSPVYKYRLNNVLQSGSPVSYTFNNLINNDQIVCELTSNAVCANPVKVMSNTITMIVGPAPQIVSSIPGRNSVTAMGTSNVQINFNQVLDMSSASDSCISILGDCGGNRSIHKLTYLNAGTNNIIFDPDKDFFAGEKVSVTVTQKTKNSAGIRPLKPLTYRYKTKSAPAPASFHMEHIPVPGNTPSALYSPESNITDLCKGDFNGDGLLDFITTAYTYNKICLFTSNGNGTFTQQEFAFLNSGKVNAGDYDDDGDLDFAYTTYSTIVAMFNDGSGSFPTSASFNTWNFPFQIASGDINGDGSHEIVYASYQGMVYVWTYKNSAFTTTGSFSCGSNPTGLCIADYDQDYDTDIIVSDLYSIYIGVNNGYGRFLNTPVVNIVYSEYTAGLAVEDFDGDSDVDLAISWKNKNQVGILLNNGNGTFATPYTFSVQGEPFEINAEDYDGDGDIDISTANNVSQTISVRLNNGTGVFSGSMNIAIPDRTVSLVSGDFDGDSDIDIITASEQTFYTNYAKRLDIYVLFNKVPDITVNSLPRNTYCNKSNISISFSFDASYSDPNLFTVQLSGATGSFVNPVTIGTGVKSPIDCRIPVGTAAGTHYRVRVVSSMPASNVTDNGSDITILNGCPDIITTSPEYNRVLSPLPDRLTLSFSATMAASTFTKDKVKIRGDYSGIISETGTYNGSSTSQLQFIPSSTFFAGEKLTVTVDSSITSLAGSPINNKRIFEVYAGTSTGKISYSTVTKVANTGDALLKLLDFDHDGDLDMIVGESNKIDLKLNDGNGNFGNNETLIQTSVNNRIRSLVITDVEEDGDYDFVTTNQSGIQIYLNDGNGTLVPGTNYSQVYPHIYTAADLDADGFEDLLLELDQLNNMGRSILQVWMNDRQGGYTPKPLFRTALDYSTLRDVQAMDIELDGDMDFVYWENQKMYIATNDGWGNLVLSSVIYSLPTSHSANDVEYGDFDGDKDIDIMIGYSNLLATINYLNLLVNDGNGTFTLSPTVNFSIYVHDLEKTDLDGDSDFDLMVCDRYGYDFRIYENLGNNNFALKSTIPVSNIDSHSEYAFAADFNSDGKMDIAVSHSEQHQVSLLMYNSSIDITSVSSINNCPGTNFNINFDAIGNFTSGNKFKAQLSDASGNFTNPIELPGLYLGIGNGVISTSLPSNIPTGSGYKLRVVSDLPVVTGNLFSFDVYDFPTPQISVTGNILSTSAFGMIYSWKLNGQIVSTSQLYNATVAGYYKVIVTDPLNSNCKDSSALLYFAPTQVVNDIDDRNFEFNNITIYPNPTERWITIDLQESVSEGILIVENSLGMELQHLWLKDIKATGIDLSGYNSGMYIIKIISADKVLTRKVILK